jgi:hypothetical protein
MIDDALSFSFLDRCVLFVGGVFPHDRTDDGLTDNLKN